MPTPEKPLPRRPNAGAEYSYRRPLSLHELVPAVGIAVGAGLFAYYITRLLLQRTPLYVEREPRRPRRREVERSADA